MKNFAAIAAPLHSLLNGGSKKKKSSVWVKQKWPDCWTEKCEQAFNTLKSKLTTAALLGYPDLSRPFVLEIDASFDGLGAVLSQDQDEGRVIISYASRGLRPHENNMNNYSSTKLELLALQWAVTIKFRDYLLGSKFIVLTDNNQLSYKTCSHRNEMDIGFSSV